MRASVAWEQYVYGKLVVAPGGPIVGWKKTTKGGAIEYDIGIPLFREQVKELSQIGLDARPGLPPEAQR